MIIEKPYDQLKTIKIKMREMARSLADLEIIVSNLQDYIFDGLQSRLDGRVEAEKFKKFSLFDEEKNNHV